MFLVLFHFLALLLPVAGFRLNPEPVANDLNITPKSLNAFLRELGCKVTRIKEKKEDGPVGGLKKPSGQEWVATLPVPLTFPKPKRKRAN